MKRLTTFFPTQYETHRQQARTALEQGGVVLLDQQAFLLKPAEQAFLTPTAVSSRRKNISYNPKNAELKGDIYIGEEHHALQALTKRYYEFSKNLIAQWFPEYVPDLIDGRCSFRVVEAEDRLQSARQDDRYLHIDAFPATPLQGQRILRVFSNINPHGKPRVWRIGGPFEHLLQKFGSQLTFPAVWEKYLLKFFKITKGLRTDYDTLMLQLHHKMKADQQYQDSLDQELIHLPAMSTWFVFTDQASHAVCSGQFCLEQTFYLPVNGKSFPLNSPLRILEQYYQRKLVS